MTTKLLTLTIFATLALGVTACGGSSDSPETQVKSAAKSFVQDAQDKNASALCADLTPASQKKLATLMGQGGTCEAAAKKLISLSKPADMAKDKAKVDTGKVTITGNTAVIKLDGSGGNSNNVNLEKVDGKWLIVLK